MWELFNCMYQWYRQLCEHFSGKYLLDHVCISLPSANLLQWRHNGHDGVLNHQPHGCLLNRLFGRRPKKTSKLRVTGLFAGTSPGPVNSPHKRTSNTENASIWWRHHVQGEEEATATDIECVSITHASWTEQTGGLQVICDAVTLMWCHCNGACRSCFTVLDCS